MRKILLTLALLFSVNSVHAADSGDWKSWYTNMVKGLKSKVERKFESKNSVSAVAAVRGSKQGADAKALYWKGGVSDAARKKLEAERKQLSDALQLVLDGSLPQGKAAIEKFIKDNPDSVYLPEAKEALVKLPAEEARPAAAPAKPAKKEAAQPKEEKAAEKAPAEAGK
jgi:TolA-binding protein